MRSSRWVRGTRPSAAPCGKGQGAVALDGAAESTVEIDGGEITTGPNAANLVAAFSTVDIVLGSFTATVSEMCGLLEMVPPPRSWTITYVVRTRAPEIGALRRWARSVSATPWRRRSIASWRWAWRQRAHATSMRFENVMISSGAGDVLEVRTRASVPENYTMTIQGRST